MKKLIDIIWTIIKISEKKENEYLDLIRIINLEGKRERERKKEREEKEKERS